ncbi:hypothetical protein ACFU8W_45670 [Streptomyces sp. NPDC057565]|uniref:hypothetical protein n=1 Tax=Streptomyces sp. NPDC057565 TaxID=3346169 RepID=UPI0036A6B2EB
MIDQFGHVADALDLRKEPRDVGLHHLATEVHHARLAQRREIGVVGRGAPAHPAKGSGRASGPRSALSSTIGVSTGFGACPGRARPSGPVGR